MKIKEKQLKESKSNGKKLHKKSRTLDRSGTKIKLFILLSKFFTLKMMQDQAAKLYSGSPSHVCISSSCMWRREDECGLYEREKQKKEKVIS
jgi:hypothetical protein